MKSRCIPIVRHNAGPITWPAVSHIVNLIFLSCKVIAFTLKSTPAQYECGTRLAFRPRLGYGMEPIVLVSSILNSSSMKRSKMDDLPTPESPVSRSLNM